ncbi:hypothetical protein G3R49_19230 [Shewanella sp. WXL01]|uniref:hypothetical protein n=1 Tax=Shewanella sp. WXL01 TaxID=2709721 RepID=UPI00143852D4|nr:hypothetical protein [Shewanella sp. WXL01]NKF52692.1 hypothetical protein [Shewanella sp. WXL01]
MDIDTFETQLSDALSHADHVINNLHEGDVDSAKAHLASVVDDVKDLIADLEMSENGKQVG